MTSQTDPSNDILAQIIAKAWTDSRFMSGLQDGDKNALKALNSLLNENLASLLGENFQDRVHYDAPKRDPEDLPTLTICQEDANHFYLVIPKKPDEFLQNISPQEAVRVGAHGAGPNSFCGQMTMPLSGRCKGP